MINEHIDIYENTDENDVKHLHKKTVINYEELESNSEYSFWSLLSPSFIGLFRVSVVSSFIFFLLFTVKYF